jgi:signal transduction histidine kinase
VSVPTASAGDRRRRRRTVSGRLLASYLVVLVAFTVTLGWSLLALRDAARDVTLVRDAYLPLVVSIGEVLAGQNVMSVQLNHITSANNPADVRQWLETANRLRPLTFKRVRDDATHGLGPGLDRSGLRELVLERMSTLAATLAADEAEFASLFQALGANDRAKAEAIRDRLVARETEGANQLRRLRQRVETELGTRTEAAQRRERRSLLLLVLLSALTLVVGVLTSLHARRLLAPLSAVTERARAVGRGDLAARESVAADGEIGELAATFEDMVAAIRKARTELVQAERLATIGKMAAHITHEVRNPLSSISLNLEMLEDELGSANGGPEAVPLLCAIRAEVDRLSQISEQYLAAAREPRLELAREDVGELVRRCHGFVRPELERAGITSRVEVQAGLPEIELDEARLRQALVNLLRNAREALSESGQIVLAVRREADRVRIEVADDGPGVPEPLRASIFDAFYTTKERGTGLGLAVTRAIVVAHGGTVRCQPRDGGGTCFVIELPVARDEPGT